MSETKQVWKFAVTTAGGIFEGEIIGELDPGDTREYALKHLAQFLRDYFDNTLHVPSIGIFVSESDIYIDWPGTTNYPIVIEAQFKR